MDRPTIVVVGLGPGDGRLLTSETRDELATATLARLRTRRHPAAASFPELASYDDLYEAAESFDALYTDIANDLVALASAADGRRIVYAVPGSPTVAERTVELLVGRDDVDVVLRPAISIIDVACSSLRRDPMTAGLRVVDALAGDLVGPGPLLVLQAYAPEVLAALAARLAPDTGSRSLTALTT
jgi:tetrapyrrole methylase family protein/MazG family protein